MNGVLPGSVWMGMMRRCEPEFDVIGHFYNLKTGDGVLYIKRVTAFKTRSSLIFQFIHFRNCYKLHVEYVRAKYNIYYS